MKKITTLAFVFTLLTVGFVNANDTNPNSPLGMSVMKYRNIVKVFYKGEQAGKVKIRIYNAQGRTVYNEVLRNTENFMRPYNFSFLPAGDYTIVLTDAKGKRTHQVMYGMPEPEQKRLAHLSRLSEQENTYVLAVPNDGRDALTVKIFGDNNALIYKNTEVVHGDFAKVYNLKNFDGSHTFEIADRKGRINRLRK